MIEFNVNDYVWVKLTDEGEKELRKQHDELRERCPNLPEYTQRGTNVDGYCQFQMWELMQRFGHMVSLGRPMPFETTIRMDFD